MLAWMEPGSGVGEGQMFCANCDNQLCTTNSFCTRCGTGVCSEKQQSWMAYLWSWFVQALFLVVQPDAVIFVMQALPRYFWSSFARWGGHKGDAAQVSSAMGQ
jgi:uncharacterized paraquat-inducible protein A